MMVIDGDYMVSNHMDLLKESIERQCSVNSCEYNGSTYIHEITVAALIHSFKARIDEQNRALESLESDLRTATQLVIESGQRIAELEDTLTNWVKGY